MMSEVDHAAVFNNFVEALGGGGSMASLARRMQLVQDHPEAANVVGRLGEVSASLRMNAALPSLDDLKTAVELLMEATANPHESMIELTKPVAYECLDVFGEMLSDISPQRTLALASGILQAAPTLTARIRMDLELAIAAAKLFATLQLVEPDVGDAAFKAGSGAAMIGLVKAQPESHDVAQICLMSICSQLGTRPDCAPEFWQEGVGETIVMCMQKHPGDGKGIQVQGIRALGHFIHIRREGLLATGGQRAVMTALRSHAKLGEVVEAALLWVSAASKSQQGEQLELPTNIHKDAMAAICQFPRHSKVQEAAWAVLSSAANRSETARAELLAGRDFEAIVLSALREHGSVDNTARGLCTVVFVLGEGHDRFNKLEIAEAILDLLAAHKRKPLVLEMVCGPLAALAAPQAMKPRLVAAGAAEKVVRALRQNTGSASVGGSACNVLRVLAVHDASVGRIVDLDVVQDAVGVLKRHPHVEACASASVVGLLMNLSARRPDTQSAILRAGAADCVLRLMRKHLEEARLQQVACGFFANVARRDQTKLMADGAGKAVLAAMRAFPAETRLLEVGCGAIEIFATGNGPNQAAFEALGAGEVLVAALRWGGSLGDERLAKRASRAMANLRPAPP